MEQISKKILIVEDDKDFLSILKTKLLGEGFGVVSAENGEEGIEVAEKENPDLIIADILMPKIDGIEMAKKIKESKNKIPIVFLTNITDDDYTEDMKKSGEFEYLIKSELRIDDIVAKLKEKLGILHAPKK